MTAKTPGEHPLILSVAIVLHETGIAAMQVAEEEYEATIHVAVRPDQRTIWTRVNDVLREPIPAALLTIGLAGLSAKGAATWWRRRRRPRAGPGTAPPAPLPPPRPT